MQVQSTLSLSFSLHELELRRLSSITFIFVLDWLIAMIYLLLINSSYKTNKDIFHTTTTFSPNIFIITTQKRRKTESYGGKNVAHHHKTQINQSAIKITTLEIRAFVRKLYLSWISGRSLSSIYCWLGKSKIKIRKNIWRQVIKFCIYTCPETNTWHFYA